MMDHIPQLRQFLYAVKDQEKLQVIEAVLDQFETRIIPNLSLYARSVIHGDYNEQNILVDICEASSDYQLAGVLDFGDTSCSCVVFDLAIAMTYLMLQSENLRTGGLVLAGYRAIRPVPQTELNILRICVAARLCQSMVMASYSYSLDPDNEYIMVSQAKAWKLMQLLWPQTDEAVLNIWLTTADLNATKRCQLT
jgi:hydroxylysine kinase